MTHNSQQTQVHIPQQNNTIKANTHALCTGKQGLGTAQNTGDTVTDSNTQHTHGADTYTLIHTHSTHSCVHEHHTTHTHTVTTITHYTALTHPAISISVRLTDQVAGLVSGMLHHTGRRGTREAACSVTTTTHHLTTPLHTPYPTYMYMCDTPTRHQYTHISDFRIAIQLTCSQHILHRYIHSHATHVFIGLVQEICKLFYISRTVSIGINGLVESATPSL